MCGRVSYGGGGGGRPLFCCCFCGCGLGGKGGGANCFVGDDCGIDGYLGSVELEWD